MTMRRNHHGISRCGVFKVMLMRPITPKTGKVVCEEGGFQGQQAGGFGSDAEGCHWQVAGFRHRNMLDLSSRRPAAR
jgi:hypothetical protein